MLEQFRDEAIRAVEEELSGLFPRPLPLPQDALQHYREGHRFVRGWAQRRHYANGPLDVRILLDGQFPYSFPRIALAEVPPPLTWPHVEDDGLLCLNAEDARLSTERPSDAGRVVRHVLERSDELLRQVLSGSLDDHFLDEFGSYWQRGERGNGKRFRSLLTLSPGSRVVAAVRRADWYLLGDTPEACTAWLNNFSGRQQGDRTTETAAYIWLDKPPYPRQYPTRRGQLARLIQQSSRDGEAVFVQALKGNPKDLLVVLAADWKAQRVLGGLLVSRPGLYSPSPDLADDYVVRGFRKGKVPPRVIAARYLGAADAPVRSHVDRIDFRWINGRDQNPSAELLHNKSVVVLGCGSLGAGVARLIAQAGVGTLHVADPDTLDWANTSRHVLGAPAVGEPKAETLARDFASDLPHLADVRGWSQPWQEVPHDTLMKADLIICMTGEWSADVAASDLQHDKAPFPPVLFGWLESHAAAAHAVLLSATGACLRCGMTPTGTPLRPVTWFPKTPQPDGACAAPYSAYGAVELAVGQSLVAQLALDYLLNAASPPAHRVWVGSRRSLEPYGGGWTKEWTDAHGDPGTGQRVYEDDWPIRASCNWHLRDQ